MHNPNDNLDAVFTAPICPCCATLYDPQHYDFVEDRACCSNCHTFYQVPADQVPDIPDDMLEVDISDSFPE